MKSLEILKLKIKFFRTSALILFILTLLFYFLKFVLILALFYNQNEFLYGNMATMGSTAFLAVENQLRLVYSIFIIWQLVIFSIKALQQCFISHGLMYNSSSVASYRNVFTAIVIMGLFFCFVNLFYSKKANNYLLSFQNSDSLINTTLLKTIFFYTILLIISNAGGIVVNAIRWRSIYLVFSVLKLILSLVFLTLGSNVLRNSQNLYLMYQNNCQSLLKLFSQDYLRQINCPYKYLSQSYNQTTIYDLNCVPSEIGLVWDTMSHANNESNSFELSCLNYDCCGLLSTVLVKEFVILGVVSFLVALFGFALAAVCFYLSLRSNLETNYYSRTIDFFKPNVDIPRKSFLQKHAKSIMSILSFVVFCVSFILASYYGSSVMKAQNFYYPDIITTQNKNNLIENLPKTQHLYTILSSKGNNNFCNNFTDAINDDALKNMISSENSASALRIALLGVNVTFAITFNYGTAAVKLFNVNLDNYRTLFFPNSSSTDDFILFEGKQNDLLLFLESSVKLCAYPYVSSQLQYVKYERNDTAKRILTLENHKNNNKSIIKQQRNDKSHKTSTSFPSISTKATAIFDSYTWGHLSGSIYDSDSKEPLNEVRVSLIPWRKTECDIQSTKDIARMEFSGKSGAVKFYNLIKKTYTVVLAKIGYKTNCFSIDFKVNSTENVFAAVMLKEFYEDEYVVTLEWKTTFNNSILVSNKSDLLLQATYTQNEKPCFVSIFSSSCDNNTISNSTQFFPNNFAFQKITFQSLIATNYLFYLQRLPFLSYNDSTSPNGIEEFGPKVKIYSSAVSSPISMFDYPWSNDTSIVKNLVWMVFCLNGEKGEIRSVGRIWGDNSTENSGNVALPTASYCSIEN